LEKSAAICRELDPPCWFMEGANAEAVAKRAMRKITAPC
jgi:hypothetical protein